MDAVIPQKRAKAEPWAQIIACDLKRSIDAGGKTLRFLPMCFGKGCCDV